MNAITLDSHHWHCSIAVAIVIAGTTITSFASIASVVIAVASITSTAIASIATIVI